MNDLSLGERLTRIEDELALVDSSLDARTRTLWAEVQKLQAIIEELKQGASQRQGE